MPAPVFIVGTGRCGSTLLSNAMRVHPRLASISELFTTATDLGGRIAECFDPGPVTADALATLLLVPPPKQTLLHREQVPMDEILYRPGSITRFSAATGVPAIMQTTLPHLAGGPGVDPAEATVAADAVFDEVAQFVRMRPPAPMAAHLAALFSWLAWRFDRPRWVERSGGSLRIVHRLAEAFPDARFVHLVRDGRDVARSMSGHAGFKLMFVAAALTEILGVDPFESADRRYAGDIPDELAGFLPEAFDAAAFHAYRAPLVLCGHYWSGEILAGTRALAALPAGRVLTLRYEAIVARPADELSRLARFVDPEPVDGAWLARASEMVRSPAPRAAIDPAAQREVDQACEPGLAAIEALT
ncbi:MAG: sulfotransferase [Kofleriaceae bacterium]